MSPCLDFRGLFFNLKPVGGDEEDRTPDPLRARQVLSQLSYTPILNIKLKVVRTLKIKQ